MIRQFEFYTWFEESSELERVLADSYGLDGNEANVNTLLEENDGLVHLECERLEDNFVLLTVMEARPEGCYLGETWGDLQCDELWTKITDFQKRCYRTCVYVAGNGLPPETVEEFLRRASKSQRGILLYSS